MVNNTSKIERMGYISNLIPQSHQKTHFLKPRGWGFYRSAWKVLGFKK